MQPNSFFLLLGDHSCCWGSSARWVRCLSSASVWSFFHGSFLFSSWKREDYMHCMNYSHSNIANLPPVSCTSLCTNTHTHTHTLPFAVMNYVHTVYSLINWRCRLRQKRLHKAIPLLFFYFSSFTAHGNELQQLSSHQVLSCWLFDWPATKHH